MTSNFKLAIETDTAIELKAALSDLVGAVAAPVVPPVGGSSAPPGETQALPFTLPDPIVPGADISLGTGKNRIDIYVASNPASGVFNDVGILVNNQIVIPKIEVDSLAGAGTAGDVHLVLNGDWGTFETVKVDFISMGPNGINALWINEVLFNLRSLVANGPYDSRGGISHNSQQVFVTNGDDVTFTAPIDLSALPPATGDVIYGAVADTIGASNNGVSVSGTLASLLAGLQDNATLTIPAVKAIGSGLISANGATIVGAGGAAAKRAGANQTIIDCTGLEPKFDKAVFVLGGDNITLKSLAITGAKDTDANGGNAAGVRQAKENINFTLLDVELYGNQDGVLAFPGNVTMDGVWAHDNGASPDFPSAYGLTHNLYFSGNVDNTVIFKNSVSENSKDVHALKSRAGTTIVDNSTLAASGRGSCLDAPNGGLVKISNSTLRLPVDVGNDPNGDHNLISFALESTGTVNASLGQIVDLNTDVIDDLSGQGLIQGPGTATLNITNVTYNGPNPPKIVGFSTVNGSFTKAA